MIADPPGGRTADGGVPARPTRWWWDGELPPHPRTSVRRRLMWTVAVLTAVPLAGLALGYGVLRAAKASGWAPVGPPDRYSSPDGRVTAVVDHRGVQLLEDGSHLWIETSDGQRWLAGCFNADDPDNDFYHLTWTDPRHAAVETVGGQVLHLALDPATGRPRDRVGTGYRDPSWGCG